MHHQEHINQDIKGDKAKIRSQQYIKLNTRAREIQQVNPGGPDNSQSIRPLCSTMPEIKIDLNGVLKLLSNLKPNKAAMPENI